MKKQRPQEKKTIRKKEASFLQASFFNQAPMGIVCIDGKNFKIIEANPAFELLLGQDVIGKDFFSLLDEESKETLRVKLSKLWMHTQPFEKSDITFNLKNKDSFSYIAFISARYEKGEVTHFYFYLTESSQHKELEMQLTHASRMQAMGQIAGGIAHDFNNLLTAIIGFSELLLEKHQIGDPSFTDIMQIQQNAHRAAGLVSQLLAFSRKQPLKPKLLNFNDALQALVPLLKQSLGPLCDFKMNLDTDLGWIKVDPHQLTQVFLNLAVNARDAMPDGGLFSIRADIQQFQKPKMIGSDRLLPGKYIRISVQDTGCGIDKENLPHIFEPFFSTKQGTAGSGTGLGLSTVYGIISQTDGYIQVSSLKEKGTTFTIYLPRFEKRGGFSPDKNSIPRQEKPLSQATVLLVEDEDAVRSFTATALKKCGLNVLECARAEMALVELKKQKNIHLLLSDIGMPGMDGQTLARLVRESYPHIKIVLMSGYYEDFDKGGKGMHFLSKPFTMKQLREKIMRVLE